MTPRTGRPRANLEQKVLADMSAHHKEMEALVAQKLNLNRPGIIAFEAACVLLTLERGSAFQKARCEPLIRRLKKTKWASSIDPHTKLSDANFLERFIQTHAPGWDWREDARQGEIEDQDHKQENERIAKEVLSNFFRRVTMPHRAR